MNMKFWLSPALTRVLTVSAVIVFLLAESLVVVSWFHPPKGGPSLASRSPLAELLITSVPAVVGFHGYLGVRQLRSRLAAQLEETTLIWFSRQFLTTVIAAYGVVIALWRL